MKKLCLLLLCCLILGLAISSCDRTSTDSSNTAITTDLTTAKLKGADYFPNKVGNQWTYRVFNYVTENWDTAVVNIIGYDTLEGIDTVVEATVWEAVWDYKTDSQYVVEYDNTVMVFETISSVYPVAKYIFPLEEGAAWAYRHAYGEAITTISTPESCTEMYDYCFYYHTTVEGVPFDDHSVYWGLLAPHVGMVRGYRSEEFNYSIINYDNWELLFYERGTGR